MIEVVEWVVFVEFYFCCEFFGVECLVFVVVVELEYVL